MGCQRGHDGQGTSPTESDLSMLSSSGISSVESSLTELMVIFITMLNDKMLTSDPLLTAKSQYVG